jgi:hypothetical protein
MHIPSGAIVPLYMVSFVLLYRQYYRINPDRRLLNLHFVLMAGAIVLIFATVSMANWSLSLIFFALALLWFGLSIYLQRQLPPLG